MAIIIADTSPLIALAKINQLQLLPALFKTVRVTQAVVNECLNSKTHDADVIQAALHSGWLQYVENPVFKHHLSKSLGLGELSSIEYALQLPEQTLLIMDDYLARKQALRCHLTIVGTAALLFMAQRKGLIASAETSITELNQVGYRISTAVVEQLKQANIEITGGRVIF